MIKAVQLEHERSRVCGESPANGFEHVLSVYETFDTDFLLHSRWQTRCTHPQPLYLASTSSGLKTPHLLSSLEIAGSFRPIGKSEKSGFPRHRKRWRSIRRIREDRFTPNFRQRFTVPGSKADDGLSSDISGQATKRDQTRDHRRQLSLSRTILRHSQPIPSHPIPWQKYVSILLPRGHYATWKCNSHSRIRLSELSRSSTVSFGLGFSIFWSKLLVNDLSIYTNARSSIICIHMCCWKTVKRTGTVASLHNGVDRDFIAISKRSLLSTWFSNTMLG